MLKEDIPCSRKTFVPPSLENVHAFVTEYSVNHYDSPITAAGNGRRVDR